MKIEWTGNTLSRLIVVITAVNGRLMNAVLDEKERVLSV
jgi:hypothetical protein